EINLLWSWPAAWTHDTDVADAITSAAHQVAAANGVFYSVILFAVAGVTLIPTYAHARRVAAGEDAEAGQQWLSAAGIDGGLLKFLEVGLALLAPALAGSAFSSVFSVLRG